MKKLILATIGAVVLIAAALLAKHTLLAAVPAGNYLELLGGHVKATLPADQTPQGFTFEAWVKPDATNGQQNILSIGNKASSKFAYEVGLNGDYLFFNYRYGTNSTSYITVGSNTDNVPATVWTHIAVALSSQSIKLFINGHQFYSSSGVTNLVPIGDTSVLGNSYLEALFGAKIFRGKVDEVRISNVNRDVAALWNSNVYQNALGVDGSTVLLWHLDETRGVTIAQDASANNFDGSLIGGDSKVHFFGVLPSATPFSLPTISWNRPILPTIRVPFPTYSNPPNSPTPTDSDSNPIPTTIRDWPRPSRPVFTY